MEVKINDGLEDLTTPEDIRALVDGFYEKVNRDDLLGPIFNEVAQIHWESHLPTMYRFWESMLLGAGTYQGAPFPKHAVLPVEQRHFERWLELFSATLNEKFRGPKSEEAKFRAVSIADAFSRRMGILTDPPALLRAIQF